MYLDADDMYEKNTCEIMYNLAEEQKADYVEAYYNEGTVYGDGLMYTLPFIKSTEVLYYNVNVQYYHFHERTKNDD